MPFLIAAINTVAAVIIALSLLYFMIMLLSGIIELRRSGFGLSIQGDAVYERPFEGDSGTFDTYVLIPCLNEQAVIGSTVAALCGGRRNTIVVVDDGSDDRTAETARAAGDQSALVLRRSLPFARQGKGAALNEGVKRVRELVSARGQNPERVIVVVMDADGRLSDGAFAHVLALFENPRVGGAQLAVRIRNRNSNFLTRFQDFQFWSMSALTQIGRKRSGTVSLGGNGQFTRLSALDQLGEEPWSTSLTEDLDLAVSLLLKGWELDTTPEASVDQQAITSLKRLFVQRRRWYQGHMAGGRRIGEIWSTPSLSNAKALEMSAYLAVPWLFDLPWSLLWHWNLVWFILRADSVFSFVTSWQTALIGIAAWYLFTFGPSLVVVVVYLRRDRQHTIVNAILLGHSFIVMNYLSFTCAWGALLRIVNNRHGWDKTERIAEQADAGAPRHIDVPSSRATDIGHMH
jgi:1,2-diacylglycerol 3-beta-glucosyltransferase